MHVVAVCKHKRSWRFGSTRTLRNMTHDGSGVAGIILGIPRNLRSLFSPIRYTYDSQDSSLCIGAQYS